MANLSLRIDDALLREAKILAVRRPTSVSRLVAEQLEELIRRDGRYDAAKRRALSRLRKSSDLGWRKPASREDLHGC